MYINILGINISTDSKQEILKKISIFLNGEESKYIVTPNPEFLLAAAKDEEFFYILNQADIAVPDGIGLALASLIMGKKIKRISGIDLISDICELAQKEKKSIFLLGGENNSASEAANKLCELYPDLRIAGAEAGLEPGQWEIKDGQWKKGKDKSKKLEVRINEKKPDILLVAFGHPKQEKWMFHSLPNLPTVKIAMGVGGSFDFIAGKIKRAPRVMRAVGLEWLWRLLQEPAKRLPRIIDAVIKFPHKFIKWKFVYPFIYRPNVACLLYKRESGRINPVESGKAGAQPFHGVKVLLAERRDEAGHWQLPQGGTDGEDIKTAGSRELNEEIGCDKFKPLASFKNLFKYKFTNAADAKSISSKLATGYKGQKQGLFIAEFTGRDSDIKINHWDHRDWQWVHLEDAVKKAHLCRQKATKIYIDKLKEVL